MDSELGFYLKCNNCGEVFDELAPAVFHMADSGANFPTDEECFDANSWSIIPEDEAI